ncbi:hypothetical protein JTB14_026230 [Gonioctena quinquepunctata]|nr:hypothetical protein JTB14_026230 [Gonioctena quinquepunctata]
MSCYDKIAPKAYKNNNRLVCKECEISVYSDDSKDEFYTKLIEELRSEGIHKEETIEKLNKKYELFYEDAITMENDLVSKIQNHIKTIDALQDELINLKRECRNIKSTVFISTQTQTEINHIEQKKVGILVKNDSVLTQSDECDNTVMPNDTNFLDDGDNDKMETKTDKQKKRGKPVKRTTNRKKEYKEEMKMILRNNIKERKKLENDKALKIDEHEATSTGNLTTNLDENSFNISNDSNRVNPFIEKVNQTSLMEELENATILEDAVNEAINTPDLSITNESEIHEQEVKNPKTGPDDTLNIALNYTIYCADSVVGEFAL